MTGGAGYVGSVSADAFIRAGHDVVVLDDLSTGHRGAVPPGATLHQGTYADADALAEPSRVRADRRDPPLRRALAGRRVDRRPVALLPGQRRRRRRRCSRPRVRRGVERLVFSSTAAVYGVPDATPIPEDAPLRPINPYGESKRTFEAALALVRPSLRAAQRLPALLQRGRRHRDARRGPRPGDPPDPERPACGRRATAS